MADPARARGSRCGSARSSRPPWRPDQGSAAGHGDDHRRQSPRTCATPRSSTPSTVTRWTGGTPRWRWRAPGACCAPPVGRQTGIKFTPTLAFQPGRGARHRAPHRRPARQGPAWPTRKSSARPPAPSTRATPTPTRPPPRTTRTRRADAQLTSRALRVRANRLGRADVSEVGQGRRVSARELLHVGARERRPRAAGARRSRSGPIGGRS